MDDWTTAPLDHFLTRATYGFTNPMPTTDEGPYMVTARDINSGRILYETARRTSEEAYKSDITDKSRPDIGDVLVTKDGTLGRMAVVDQPNVCINQSVALLKPKETIRPRFLKYLLEEPRNFARMLGDADGTTIKHIYITRLAKMEVSVPSVSYQDRVLGVLASLDDKIELNRRMNETLEEMARALFRDWFVDFGPTHRKAAGETDPVKILGGAIPSPQKATPIAELFPDSFGEDGLPVGWEITELSSLCDIKSGKRPPVKVNSADQENSIPVWGGNGISWFTNRILFAQPLIITGRVGTLGTVYRVEGDIWVSDNALCLFPYDGFHEILFQSLKILDFEALNSGSTQPLLTQTALKKQPCIKPPKKLADHFQEIASLLNSKIVANEEEIKSLIALRDLLLPKLMSGEVHLREVENTL